MTNPKQNGIRGLPSGVPGFDLILGGGVPESSFTLIAGGPGSGKTTLAHQFMFANSTVEKPALYFTVLGEPTLKMLRYQSQFGFFKQELTGSAIQFINLSTEVLEGQLDRVLDRIVSETERAKPGIVVVDSFRTIGGQRNNPGHQATFELEHFIQRLALNLSTWEVTSFLLGEYAEEEVRNPIFTVADGILWLSQAIDRNSVVRKFQAVKMRGRAPMPGLHTFRITDDGLHIYPRIPEQTATRKVQRHARLSTGVEGIDAMIGGGVIAGDAIMLTGPAGSGKSTVATQFIGEGLSQGETGVIAVFEEYPEEYIARASSRNPKLRQMIKAGKLEIIYLRPLDLSVDEALAAILESVERLGAKRVVIDSLSGFEVALAPTFRTDFRESFYRLVGTLTACGITVFMTAEVADGFPDTRFTSEKVSFITDEIIIQRYVEVEGQLRRVMAVIKMRGSDHSHDFRFYEMTSRGVVVGETLRDYEGIITGAPRLRNKLLPTQKPEPKVASKKKTASRAKSRRSKTD